MASSRSAPSTFCRHLHLGDCVSRSVERGYVHQLTKLAVILIGESAVQPRRRIPSAMTNLCKESSNDRELPTAATGVWAYATGSSFLNLHALLKFEVFPASTQKAYEVKDLLVKNMNALFVRITVELVEAVSTHVPNNKCQVPVPSPCGVSVEFRQRGSTRITDSCEFLALGANDCEEANLGWLWDRLVSRSA